jgi:hypothetical protein
MPVYNRSLFPNSLDTPSPSQYSHNIKKESFRGIAEIARVADIFLGGTA